MEYRNPVRLADGRIDCEINLPEYGWIPFTASPEDVEENGRVLFALLNAIPDLPDAPPPPAVTLADRLAELAAYRWTIETAGITIPPGIQVPTDRESSAKITAAVVALDQGLLPAPIRWKMVSGWVDLSQEMVIAVGTAVARHVQKCFEAESAVADALAMDLNIDIPTAFVTAYGNS